MAQGHGAALPGLTVRSLDGVVNQVNDALWVHVPLADGGTIGIYPGHAPLLAMTAPGTLRYADSAGVHEFDIAAGILRITSRGVLVLCGEMEWNDRVADASTSRLEAELRSQLARAVVHGEHDA